MFGLKERVDYLEDTLKNHRAELKRLGVGIKRLDEEPCIELVTCEKCGCAVIKEEALKGVEYWCIL